VAESLRCIGYEKTKHVLVFLGATPESISLNFFLCECAPWPLTYIAGFIQIRLGLGR